ncbi:hypothetical protein [Archaeoglobus profundus]|uniref:Uncharacterized protein n=1 Tax=Archaeoglobus profundus (strain DSM 5631 / JCM 9629 / NBRC 100127 / Av18) TaxID=572546 RepID=D2RG00_ARCPA|nr:hypothetical protein [Archaeoglobus profundus]ADB57225.1 hypothetical protein Arcpr_0153 [Archaeoglobus profundus DSM 5631]
MRWYSAILFIMTLAAGLLEIVGGLKGEMILQLFPSDVFGGLVLIVVSAIFLRGLTHDEHDAFFGFGSLMLAVFGVLYTLVLLTNGLDAWIVGDEWNPLNDLRVEILLLPLAIPGLTALNRARKTLPP